MEVVMKQAHRLFNLLIPFNIYRELKNMSDKTEQPLAEIVRRGITMILKGEKNREGYKMKYNPTEVENQLYVGIEKHVTPALLFDLMGWEQKGENHSQYVYCKKFLSVELRPLLSQVCLC